jgi:Glycosyltransferase family 17
MRVLPISFLQRKNWASARWSPILLLLVLCIWAITYSFTILMVHQVFTHEVSMEEMNHLSVDGNADAVRELHEVSSVASNPNVSSSSMVKDILSLDSLPSSANVGILSSKEISFFRNLQNEIDRRDPKQRCQEYGFRYYPKRNTQRRVFFGALIASESWELLDISAAESYGVFAGIVFVESNRTQNLTPRSFQRLNDAPLLSRLYGTTVQVRSYINEDRDHYNLEYEHAQRQEILRGWKEMGMQPEDVGFLGDSDEMFSRDFLRVVQTCDDISHFQYDGPKGHSCRHGNLKLISYGQVFESTPECVTDKRSLHHPDMLLGHCIEGIGGHPPAPRDPYLPLRRAQGHGSACEDWQGEDAITDPKLYSSWNAADFRRTCGGTMVHRKEMKGVRSPYTAYHLHNFFNNFNQTRFKYWTYGHQDEDAMTKNIEDMSNDLKMMYRCVKDLPDDPDQMWKRVMGGYNATLPFQPIYFADADYRRRRHAHVQSMIAHDDALLEQLRASAARV